MLGILSALLLGVGGSSEVPKSLLIIIADDVAATDLEVIPTPTVDALAVQGMNFRRAYSMAVCSATRETMFFGEWSIRHRRTSCDLFGPAMTNPVAHDLSRVSIADVCSANGMATGLFGKWHLGLESAGGRWEGAPGEQGFGSWYATSASAAACGGSGYFSWKFTRDGSNASSDSGYNTTTIALEARQWIDAQAGPFFAWVSFNASHTPFHDPDPAALPPGYKYPETDRGRFEAAVVAMDRAIGDLLESVDLEDTLVVFVGDNGTPRGALRLDQDALRVKRSTFEDGIHVPMIIAGPGVEAGESGALVHVVDVYATALELFGSASTSGDGVSLVGALEDASVNPRSFIYAGHRRNGIRDRAIVAERWKYRENPPLGQFELYDMKADPSESSPFLEGSPEWLEHAPGLIAILNGIEGN